MKYVFIILLSPIIILGFVIGVVRVSIAAGQEIAGDFGRWVAS